MEGIELGGDQQFCLRWNNFQANITSQFETLRDDEDFVDVTLACEGHRLEAHKVVLSACSPYFKELFKSNPCPHPIIFMRDCELIHVTALLEFMYAGEVNIAQAQLTAFLRTAEALQIRGLTDSSSSSKSKTETKHANQKSPPSQLRNLLSAKPSNTTSSSKAVSQNAELFNNDGDKTASSPNIQHRKLSSDDPDNDANGSHGNGNSANDNVFPTSSQMRPNNEHREKNNYGAVRLKSDLALMERKNEDYEKKDSDGSNTTNEDDNQRTGKINPFAVGGGGYTDTEMLNNMLEPKMEMPDYASDDDMKQERAAFTSETFYDATNSLANPFASLQGSVDFMAGLNQDYTEDGIEGRGAGGAAASGRVRCARCGRRYSNVSNLRQHVRLIHESQPVACPTCGRCFKTPLYLRRHTLSQHAHHSTHHTHPTHSNEVLHKMQGKAATLTPIANRPTKELQTGELVQVHHTEDDITVLDPESVRASFNGGVPPLNPLPEVVVLKFTVNPNDDKGKCS